jgi:glycogen debranching enzyme
MNRRLLPALLLLLPISLFAQTQLPPLTPVASFPIFSAQQPRISQQVVPRKPFSVVGPRGALLGRQDGRYEAWVFPWKIFSGMRMTVRMQNYPVPIPVNTHAAWIDVQPYATTITYSHANFTIRQIMFAPKRGAEQDGAVVLYELEAVRPMDITFSLRPVMQRMWPANSPDAPSPEWVSTQGHSGFYVLHLPFPKHAAALAIPGAEPGVLAPYQERARSWPLQFVLHYDPAKDRGKLYPLLIAMGANRQQSSTQALYASLASLDHSTGSLFDSNRKYYDHLLAAHTSLDTPDARLNEAFEWAISAIDQLRVKTTPHLTEEALTAGFVGSGNTARPGFGWFFGRDALWSLYAVNSYGGFKTTRQEIDFLLHRQRANGEIMHEWSQTADLVDWKSLPYEYASADATPLLLMAMNDYYTMTGDESFVASKWSQLRQAWSFETSHDSSDGIYNNSAGSGWVESWVPSMPHQEIYLALLDEQASEALANLALATHHDGIAQQAEARAQHIRKTIEREYYMPSRRFYAFSHNADGSVDKTATIFPAVAWWSHFSELDNPEGMMSRWASNEFATDWGSRILSDKTSFYDPISYHQGSVWPLFTGWAAVAEYRDDHPLAGYASMMQNVDLTWSQDPGDVTELLSGKFYQVLGRSTAHQLWSSAMVISPVLRGMFGLEWDAPHGRLYVSPHLPADWPEASIHRLPFGKGFVDLDFRRENGRLTVTETATGTPAPRLVSRLTGAKSDGPRLEIPLPPVQVFVPRHLPEFGAETHQLKVTEEAHAAHSYTLTLAAPAGGHHFLDLYENSSALHLQVEGARLSALHDGRGRLTVDFPAGHGYVPQKVRISW